jgi:hypothetical protein
VAHDPEDPPCPWPPLGPLLGPAGPELTCEACFAELDRYVDLRRAGADADAAVPGMRAHLDGCPACAEDHLSLRDLTAGDGGGAMPPP